MRNKLIIILLSTISIYAETVILFTEITDPRFREFRSSYTRKFRDLWDADSGVTLIPQDLVEKIRYRSRGRDDSIPLDSTTASFLRRYGHDSVIAVVPQLDKFSIAPKRGIGIRAASGSAVGELIVRFRFVDLSSGTTRYTGTVESDTSISLGLTMVRPLDKSVNISAYDRDRIVNSLIDLNVRESYRILTIHQGESREDPVRESQTDSTDQ